MFGDRTFGLVSVALALCSSLACSVAYVPKDTAAENGSGYPDFDEDTILDYNEYAVGNPDQDNDADAIVNWKDDDSDGDTILDAHEAGDADPLTLPFDSDADGIADFLDLDSDNNCLRDWEEKGGENPRDRDGDFVFDFADDDNDGDGIKDIYEIGEACEPPDSDRDGIGDYMDDDSDGDGVGDAFEGGTTPWQDEPIDTDRDGVPDYLDEDSDGDGFSDSAEAGVADTTETPRDTDGDGLYDFADADSDGDGLSDLDEATIHRTDPYDADSDGDGFSDGSEVFVGADPLDPGSIVEGVYVEVPERTRVEEAFDFELQIQLGDIAFLVDTTCSMSSTLNTMKSQYAALVSAISVEIPDAQYGFATYDDYPSGGFGTPGTDQAFLLRQQISDDTALVQAAISAATIHSGADGPESSMEALYQGITGHGYDLNCNGVFDSTQDIKPFLASGADPFGGAGGQSYNPASSGGGLIGGFGFREYALPVLIYATDNFLRDPDTGYASPRGCPLDAGSLDVTAELTALGGYVIGIGTNSTPIAQMNALAAATGSYADTDGDGAVDDLLVFQQGASSLTTIITDAVKDLISSVHFESITLEIEGDEWGFVTGVSPDSVDVSGDVNGTVITFTLEFLGTVAATAEDQLYQLTLNVIGDETVLLDTLDIIVVVPGTSA